MDYELEKGMSFWTRRAKSSLKFLVYDESTNLLVIQSKATPAEV